MTLSRRIFTVALLGLLMLPAGAQDPASAPAPASDGVVPADLTEAGMTARLVELRPHIERVLGASLGEALSARPVHASFMAASVAGEIFITQPGLAESTTVERLRGVAGFLGEQIEHALLGKVDIATGDVLIAPAAFHALRHAFPGEPLVASQSLLDIVLVHEAVHVHQLRKLGLFRAFAASRTRSQSRCVQSVTEGHAQWVARRVAKDLRLDPALAFYERLHTGDDEAAPPVQRILARAFAFPYVEGERFVAAVFEALGTAAGLSRIMETPPTSLSHIRHPREWMADEPGPPVPDPTARPTRPITGRIRYAGDGGTPSKARIELWCGSPPEAVAVALAIDGTFATDILDGVPCRLGKIVADGIPHLGLLGEPLIVERDGPIALELEPRDVITVEVRDAATGRPLPGARVYLEDPFTSISSNLRLTIDDRLGARDFERSVFPAPELLLQSWTTTGEDGRCRMPRDPSVDAIYAVAEGHAWARAEVPEADPKSVVVELLPGGASLVSVRDLDRLEDPHVYLQLHASESAGLLWLDVFELPEPLGSAPLMLEGLPEGLHRIIVRGGEWTRDDDPVASGVIRIVPGERADLELGVPTDAQRVDARLIVSLPEGWGPLPMRALVRSPSAADVTPHRCHPADGEREILLELEGVSCGTYQLELPELAVRQAFEVTAELPEARMALPPPGEIEVVAVDASTGAPIPGERLHFQLGLAEETSRPCWSQQPQPSSADDRPVLRCLPGRGDLVVLAEGYVAARRAFEVAPGARHRIELRLEPAGAVRIQVRVSGPDGSEPAEEHELAPIEVNILGVDLHTRALPRSGGMAVFDDVAPGRFKVEIAAPAGFEPVPVRPIDVLAGRRTELTIDLVRRAR